MKSPDDLEQSLVRLRAEEKSRAEHVVRQSLDISLEFKLDQKVRSTDFAGMPQLYRLASTYKDFIGQVVIDEDYVAYASLINRETVLQRPLRHAFRFLGGE